MFLLAGEQAGFSYTAFGPFIINKEYKNLKKWEVQDIFTEMN